MKGIMKEKLAGDHLEVVGEKKKSQVHTQVYGRQCNDPGKR